MPKPPKPKKPKDPARPTRSKAAAEHMKPLAPALEQLLNPGIAKGTAGVGSQTGPVRDFLHLSQRGEVGLRAIRVRGFRPTRGHEPPHPDPLPHGEREKSADRHPAAG